MSPWVSWYPLAGMVFLVFSSWVAARPRKGSK
jgi:hypothetical protein